MPPCPAGASVLSRIPKVQSPVERPICHQLTVFTAYLSYSRLAFLPDSSLVWSLVPFCSATCPRPQQETDISSLPAAVSMRESSSHPSVLLVLLRDSRTVSLPSVGTLPSYSLLGLLFLQLGLPAFIPPVALSPASHVLTALQVSRAPLSLWKQNLASSWAQWWGYCSPSIQPLRSSLSLCPSPLPPLTLDQLPTWLCSVLF